MSLLYSKEKKVLFLSCQRKLASRLNDHSLDASFRWHDRMIIIICLFLLLLSGCATSTHRAPVVEAVFVKLPPKGYYRARPSDTLYAIAWSYNIDYRLLAKYNQLSYPYHIHPGQILRLDPRKPLLKGLPLNRSIKNINLIRKQMLAVQVKEPFYHAVSGWSWPAKGILISGFNPAIGNKGINLAGKPGTPILATAAGEVVYCGNGLQAYGQMIIIKHNSDYFSAYAHNKKLFVKEGERVKSRQIIAQMGNSGTDRTMLHFEIRRSGKPVNPLALLPRY